MPELRVENQAEEEKLSEVIYKFKLKQVGPKVIKVWQDYVEEVLKEKEREKYKSEMWNKVNSWLTELDEKHTD